MPSKISRVTNRIFGSTPGGDSLSIFGSMAAGSPVFSTDPTEIQSLSQWLTGWFSAVVGQNSPAIEDFNSLCFVLSYQLGYILQQGIPEWDAGTSYFTNSYCTSSGVIYVSLQDNNLNNAVSDGSFWTPQFITRNNLPNVGQVVSSSSGTFSTSSNTPVAVTNLTVTLACTGRLVNLLLQPDGTSNAANMGGSGAAGEIYIYKDGSPILTAVLSNGVTFPSLAFQDTPSAGSHTYTVYVSASAPNVDVQHIVLSAYEAMGN